MPEQGDILLIPVPFTLSQSIVLKTFGRVDSNVLDRIRTILQDLIANKA